MSLLEGFDPPEYERELEPEMRAELRREAIRFRLSGLSSIAEWQALPVEDRIDLAHAGFLVLSSQRSATALAELTSAFDDGSIRRYAALIEAVEDMKKGERHGQN